MKSPFFDREISDEHANKLKRAMLIREHEELPDAVKDLYWRMKAACDRLSCNPNDQLFVMVILAAGELPDVQPPSAWELAKSGELKRGDPVIVKWAKKSHPAKFLSTTNGSRLLVEVQGEERAVDPATVSIPELETV